MKPLVNKAAAGKATSPKPARKKSAAKEPIRVAVLESDPLRFVGLRALFGSGAEFRVRVSTVPFVLKALDDDVVLMTRNRGAAFYSAMSCLKAVRPGVRIIVTGPGRNDEDILRAIMAGAKGYVPEDADPADFRKAIRHVHSGRSGRHRGCWPLLSSGSPPRPLPVHQAAGRPDDQPPATPGAGTAGRRQLQPRDCWSNSALPNAP